MLTNVGNFNNLTDYVSDKIARYTTEEKSLRTLYSYMFSERENTFAEISDGYRVQKITYGECADAIEKLTPSVVNALAFLEKGNIVGLYMDNSVDWIKTFWAIIKAGYNPLLINARLPMATIEDTLKTYAVGGVISDSKTFEVPTLQAKEIFSSQALETTQEIDSRWGEEVLFMSSGTTNNVKLCAYTGENFFYQICDSAKIVRECPQMGSHYEGELKQLTLLPFYHVFGFIAVYLWFGFFSRTLVFLKDLHPQTILATVRKHKVTHIFAVPLVWETVYKAALKKIRAREEKTYQKFQKALRFVNKSNVFGSCLAKLAFKEVRENLFGESIQFLITGGSGISSEALQFFNGIGYHMANGYGMSEVGITSVEISLKRKQRNLGSIGAPFGYTEYSVSERGELLIRGRTRASRILQAGQEKKTDFNEWFATSDLVKQTDGKYYILGREDDLIVCKNGENLNPEILEKRLRITGVDELCLFADENGTPTLLLSAKKCFSADTLRQIYAGTLAALDAAHLRDEVTKVAVTTDKLLGADDFKISRKKIAKRYQAGQFQLLDPHKADEQASLLLSGLEKEICICVAEVLQKDVSEISPTADFFTDLGGSSLDYFALLDSLQERFDLEAAVAEEANAATVQEIYQLICKS